MGVKLDTIAEQALQVEEFKLHGRRYRVTAFTARHRIEGTAFVSPDAYNESWRSSDFMRSIDEERLVLGEVEIRDVATGTIVDKPDFVMLNLRTVEVVYARELE